jgi:hypothetical protein
MTSTQRNRDNSGMLQTNHRELAEVVGGVSRRAKP